MRGGYLLAADFIGNNHQVKAYPDKQLKKCPANQKIVGRVSVPPKRNLRDDGK